MEIGLDDPEDYEALRRILEIGRLVRELRDKLPSDPVDLAPEGSDLGALMATLPEPPVDPRLSIYAGLDSAAGCFLQIVSFIKDGIPTTPVVLPTLARTALLAASRVVFVLGPDDASDRERNTRSMLRQESSGLMRLYAAAEQFQSFSALVPPQDVLDAQRARAESVNQGVPLLGEAVLLREMAWVVGKILAARGYADTAIAGQVSEHVAWTFNVYSGVAHGFAWPRLVPGTRSLPGHFIAELLLISNVTHLAFDLAIRRSTVRG